ncbi:MAG: hypothetical protein HKO57_17515 [Akkermansiaceae bacterium]|nr:hypothetical protein [Akkermansiaceae bacterium]
MAGALIALATSALGEGTKHGDPYVPVGSLSVSPRYVPAGTKPTMNWSIRFPENLPDIVDVAPNNLITTKRASRVRIRVIGVGYGLGKKRLPVALWTQVGNGPWQGIFSGTSKEVKSDRYLFDTEVPAGTPINLAARGASSSGGWEVARMTGTDHVGVAALSNGDLPPSYTPAYDQGSIESFLSSYIGKNNNGHGNNIDGVDSSNPGNAGFVDSDPTVDDESKRLSLGPKELIYLFELGTQNTSSAYFDMQDLVVLVTFAE